MLVALSSLSAPPVPAQQEQPLLPGTTALAASSGHGASHQCRCWSSHEPKLVFYNRVPKCGSTTMLRYIDAASRKDGFSEEGHRRSFGFFSSADFNSDHFHPDQPKRHEILREMVRQSAGKAALFERHIHYLEFDDMDDLEIAPTYINLLRDPGTLRASSFYFARDCICNQRGGFMDSNNQWQLQDTWCQNEWYRKSDTLCSMDINECYEDRESCHELFPKGALGGTVMIDFLCGCVAGSPSPMPCVCRCPCPVSFARLFERRHAQDGRSVWAGAHVAKAAESKGQPARQVPVGGRAREHARLSGAVAEAAA